jgi:hypothetical protein
MEGVLKEVEEKLKITEISSKEIGVLREEVKEIRQQSEVWQREVQSLQNMTEI